MKTLLKDTPGFSEPIENNMLLLSKITDLFDGLEIENDMSSIESGIISTIAVSLKDAEFTVISGNEIQIDDRQSLAQSIFDALEEMLESQKDFILQNTNDVANSVLSEITEFVNENYTQK